MKTIRNLINDQTNEISFCGDTEEVLKQDALDDIKELNYKTEHPEWIDAEKDAVIAYIKFKHNLDND